MEEVGKLGESLEKERHQARNSPTGETCTVAVRPGQDCGCPGQGAGIPGAGPNTAYTREQRSTPSSAGGRMEVHMILFRTLDSSGCDPLLGAEDSVLGKL